MSKIKNFAISINKNIFKKIKSNAKIMKAIILAAWAGTRLKPLTNTIPKPMISIFGKPILEHNLEAIYEFVDEIIIIIKYKQEIIKEYFKDNFNWVKITYIEQWEEKWTGWALKWLNLQDDVIILYWDSILDKNDLKKVITSQNYAWLVKEVETPEKYWIYKQNSNWFAIEVIEKPQEFVGNLANLWWFKFSPEIFKHINNIWLSVRWEYELTDAINLFLKDNKFELIKISWEFIDVWYPWDILTANKYFLDKLQKSEIKWTVENWVTIKWNIILEEWAILKSGTYIEWNVYIWKNTSIGPNTYLRWQTVIWENCHIWNAVEIKNTSIWNKTNVAHLSYIWDSILGNNINIWGGMITANLRHDKWNIKVMVNGSLVDSGLHKLWVIIWDNSKTGIKTMTYPGRIIENDSFTMPGEIVK